MKFVSLDQKGIGKDLKRARLHLALSLKQVATEAKVAASHVWNLENGASDMSLEKFFSLSSTLGLSCGQVVADNIQIDQQTITRVVYEQVRFMQPDLPDTQAALWANYTSAWSAIIIFLLLTPGSQMGGDSFDFPIQSLRDAFSVLDMRIRTDLTLKDRRNIFAGIQEGPLQIIQFFGLTGEKLFLDFVKWSASHGKELKPWKVTLPKAADSTYSSFKNILAAIDPQEMGKVMRQTNQAGITALANDLKKRGKSRKKASKLVRKEYIAPGPKSKSPPK